jgi:hypothetical protein
MTLHTECPQCHYAQCHLCQMLFILSVENKPIMLSVIILSVVMLNVVAPFNIPLSLHSILNAIMLNVIYAKCRK